MTKNQYQFVNQLRIAAGHKPLLRCYKHDSLHHAYTQIIRALKVCSPYRHVHIDHTEQKSRVCVKLRNGIWLTKLIPRG